MANQRQGWPRRDVQAWTISTCEGSPPPPRPPPQRTAKKDPKRNCWVHGVHQTRNSIHKHPISHCYCLITVINQLPQLKRTREEPFLWCPISLKAKQGCSYKRDKKKKPRRHTPKLPVCLSPAVREEPADSSFLHTRLRASSAMQIIEYRAVWRPNFDSAQRKALEEGRGWRSQPNPFIIFTVNGPLCCCLVYSRSNYFWSFNLKNLLYLPLLLHPSKVWENFSLVFKKQ